MTGKELADGVHACLPLDAKERIKKEDVHLIVKLVFETIVETIMLDDDVVIRNFGKISASFTPGGQMVWCEPVKRMVPRKPNVRLKLTPAKRLKDMVTGARANLRALAKKEQEKSLG